MLFYIHYQGKEHKVRVESRHNQTYVSFDGSNEEPVDLMFHGNDCLYIHRNHVFQGNVVRGKTDFTIWRPKGNLTFKVESEYKRIVGLLRGSEAQDENKIYAKMPGKIAKVSIKKGDTVQKGDSVMVMEAMKMENEIRSPRSGQVSNIHVSEGQAVETVALLAEIAPTEE